MRKKMASIGRKIRKNDYCQNEKMVEKPKRLLSKYFRYSESYKFNGRRKLA
jgi:hypothetical protein